MEKRAIIQLFADQIASTLETMSKAALDAHNAATHSESKAEDQYDTRGLEASYLAGAQARRASELKETLELYRHLDIGTFTALTPISATALVELVSEGKHSFCLMMPKGGGMFVQYEGNLIANITPQSPLGQALLGRRVGDEFSVDIQKQARDYEILRVW